MEADIRSDTKRTNGKGLTYQRVPSQPLNTLTRNVPTTGKTTSWRATTSAKGPDGLTARVPGLKRQIHQLESCLLQAKQTTWRGQLVPKVGIRAAMTWRPVKTAVKEQ